MNIKIYHGIKGARKAKGLTVIIDVFRAFTLEAYLYSKNINKIVICSSNEECFDYKKKHDDVILIGEKNGIKIDGFDYGNSPFQTKDIDFNNKTIVHKTSAGTLGIINANKADEILTGALVNSKAIASYIKSKNPKHVSLVAMGLNGLIETDEDNLCANYIKDLLEDKNINYEDIYKQIENLKYTSGEKFFKEENKDIFPNEDYYFSTKMDIFNFVLKIKKSMEISVEKLNIKS